MATSEAADEEVRSQVEVDPAGNGEATQLQEPEDEQLLQNVSFLGKKTHNNHKRQYMQLC